MAFNHDKKNKYTPPIYYDPCNKSPTGAHHWILNSSDLGICKYCKREKQFGVAGGLVYSYRGSGRRKK